jgi:hypothetical protein
LFVDGGGIAVVLETFALRPMAQVDKFWLQLFVVYKQIISVKVLAYQ